jgi:hypothetical protein
MACRTKYALPELGMGLEQKAVEAVGTWRFEPAKKDGRPVAVQTNVEVTFRLYRDRRSAVSSYSFHRPVLFLTCEKVAVSLRDQNRQNGHFRTREVSIRLDLVSWHLADGACGFVGFRRSIATGRPSLSKCHQISRYVTLASWLPLRLCSRFAP